MGALIAWLSHVLYARPWKRLQEDITPQLYLHTPTDWVPLSAIGDASSKLDRVVHVCMCIGVNACQVAEGSIVRAG